MKNVIKNTAKVLGAAAALTLAAGCGLMGKELAEGLATPQQDYSQKGVTFKEVSYGEAVGTVVTPNFRVTTNQIVDTLGMTLQEAGTTRNVLGNSEPNLPEIGVSSNMGANQVFAYSKIFAAACTDKRNVDGNAARPDRAYTFDQNVDYNAGVNVARWDVAFAKLGELLWGRSELTAGEKAALTELRNSVAVDALARGQNRASSIQGAFQAVCLAMALSPAHLVQ